MFSKLALTFYLQAVVSILFRKYFFQFVLLQFRTDDTDPADVIRLAVADFRFFRHHVEFQPAAFFCLDDAFCTQHRPEVLSHTQKLQQIFQFCAAESMNCLDAPACEHFVRMVMVFVFMVVMMIFMVVIVAAARAVRSVIVVVLVVMVFVLLVIVVMLVIMMVMSVIMIMMVLVVMIMMMLVVMVLMMHMRNQLHHLFLQIVTLLQRSLDHITGKFVPLRCHDSRFLIFFTKQLDAFL